MATVILNQKLNRYANSLKNSYRKNELPSTIIGAEYKHIQVVEKSGSPPVPLVKKLEHELVKIGPIGTKGLDNYIGCCCEVRASNAVITKWTSVSICDIEFTEAIRPRTGQIIKRCKNCKQIFG